MAENKPAVLASPAFCDIFNTMSKAALIDALWCACSFGGKHETETTIAINAARLAVRALTARGDRIHEMILISAQSQPRDERGPRH